MGTLHQRLGIDGGHENCVACHPEGPGKLVQVNEPIYGSAANGDPFATKAGKAENMKSREQQKENDLEKGKPEEAGASGSSNAQDITNNGQHPAVRVTPTPPYASNQPGANITNSGR